MQKGFPWLVYVKENGKKMALVLDEVIMEDADDSFGSSFKGQGFYLVFYFKGKVFYHVKDIIRDYRGGF